MSNMNRKMTIVRELQGNTGYQIQSHVNEDQPAWVHQCLDTTKEILNNPKDRSIETIQTEKQIDTK